MQVIDTNYWAEMSKRGDRNAFSRLYDLYIKRIYTFIYYKTLHKETTEDLTSQTFIKALENIGSFNAGKGSFSTWLYTLARNVVIDHFRKTKPTVDIADIWDLAGQDDVELDTQNRLLFQRISGLIQNLPAVQREIVLLRVWEDLSYRQIAEILGKSEASCKMMFSRTMLRLRSQISLTALLLLIFSAKLHLGRKI